jgi:hypothetical protein
MLHVHATWPDVNGKSGGNSVEQGIYELQERMRLGKFKVFRGLTDFFNEFRQYHRDDNGKIVKTQDDILDAVRYAYMMRRFAVQFAEVNQTPKAYIPPPVRAIGRR